MVVEWLVVIGTFLAIIVAIFQDKIREWLTRPQLSFSINVTPPDCNKTPIYRYQDGEVVAEADSYYFRLRVRNEGNEKAESVEVMVNKLSKQQEDGTFKSVETFLPMNLKWSHHINKIYLEAISRETGKYCDLGRIIDPKRRGEFADVENVIDPEFPQDQTVLSLVTSVRSYPRSHLLLPGRYLLDVMVAAANASPVTMTLEITLPGKWFNDEREMLEQGIGITMRD